jgi:hypothetical protein
LSSDGDRTLATQTRTRAIAECERPSAKIVAQAFRSMMEKQGSWKKIRLPLKFQGYPCLKQAKTRLTLFFQGKNKPFSNKNHTANLTPRDPTHILMAVGTSIQ